MYYLGSSLLQLKCLKGHEVEEELGFIGWQQKEEMGRNGKIAQSIQQLSKRTIQN